MLSTVVILSGAETGKQRFEPAVALTRSLASLVPALIAGAIRDMTIAGPAGRELSEIANHAGCGFVEAQSEPQWFREALVSAEERSVLVVSAGYVPGAGFIEELRDDFGLGAKTSGVFRANSETWPGRLIPLLSPIAAAIAPQAVWLASPTQSFQRSVRALNARSLRTKMHFVG